MALTLKAAIAANDTTFDVLGSDALSPGDLKTIGSEIIGIRTANRGVQAYGEAAYWRVGANRGELGTAKAAHAASAALTATSLGGAAAPPGPWQDPTTMTPEQHAQWHIDNNTMEEAP